jgi:hypothetical protein
MKVRVPDGKGGWSEVEGEVVAKDQKADAEKQQAALQEEFIKEAGGLTEFLVKCLNARCRELGLSKEHMVFGMALACINLREEYPEGKEAFDTIAQSAADYYDDVT